jgi:ribonuclease HII
VPSWLDAAAREELATEIKAKAESWCVAFVEVEEIDTINIYWAGIQAMQRAVRGLGLRPQHLLTDAKRLKEIDLPQQAIIKGDAKSASIAAASILAKVERDTVMRTLDIRHPGYGFADHKGYPVPAHYEALARLGACAVHRRSFGPVRLSGRSSRLRDGSVIWRCSTSQSTASFVGATWWA